MEAGPKPVSRLTMPSAPEILKALLEALPEIESYAPGGVFVGPANPEAEAKGCIVIAEAGQRAVDPDVPFMRSRHGLAFLSPRSEQSDMMDQYIRGCEYFDPMNMQNTKGRRVLQPSNGRYYLVRGMYIDAGPSADRESDVTLSTLLWVGLNIVTVPISQG